MRDCIFLGSSTTERLLYLAVFPYPPNPYTHENEQMSPENQWLVQMYFLSHRIHVWCIYTYNIYINKCLYIYHKNQPNVGKYTSPMDPMGMEMVPFWGGRIRSFSCGQFTWMSQEVRINGW